jgi:hypothetical protein
MKKALVLSLFVMLGVGVACSAQLQGEWDTWLKFHPDTSPMSFNVYSFLDIQYLVGGWTLEASTTVDNGGLDSVWMEAWGALGAFSDWAFIYFNPGTATQTASFLTFENIAQVSIAGVDIYAAFAIQDGNWIDSTGPIPAAGAGQYGVGFALGGIGTAGDIRIGAEITWNLYSALWSIFNYGIDGNVNDWSGTYCASDIWNPYWYYGGLGVVQSSCTTMFSYATVIAEFPICCADVYVAAQFSCTNGFEGFGFFAKSIDIGIPWVKLYDVSLWYTPEAKAIDYDFQIVTGDVVCFKPYLSVVMQGANIVDGFSLNALTLSCTLGGCEFYWGHIFQHNMMRYSGYYWSGLTGLSPYFDNYYFAATGGGLTYYETKGCAWSSGGYYPNEMFGIQCDEDSCCGGLFSFSLNNFFTTEAVPYGVDGIFGWMGSYIELTVGVGSNVSLVGGLNVTALGGTDFVTLGVKVAW